MTSCRKYLDEKPDSSLRTPTTVADLQGLLDNGTGVMNEALSPAMGESAADDYFFQQLTYDGRPTYEQDLYKWSLVNVFSFPNDWSRGYGPIYNANYCLEMIEKIEINGQNQMSWNNVKGSALFYRAYNFLNLTWNHAKAFDALTSETDLGIALRLQSDFNVPSIRASVAESYRQIINDAKESIIYLAPFPVHTFRPSKTAAYGLLARAYLSMRMYDSAYRYSELYLQLKSDLIDYKSNNTGDPSSIVSNILSGTVAVFKKFNKETIFYTEMANGNPASTISTTRIRCDTTLFATYTNTDLRRTGFFRADGNYQRFRGSYAEALNTIFTGIATDEMYLIKAECLARGLSGNTGDKDAAMLMLNTLLFKRHTNAFTGLTAVDANDALNKILLERRKELIFRGLRWSDIKRLNKEGRNIIPTRVINSTIFTLQPNANYYALPLPYDIINLTGMPQNPL